MNRRFFDIVKFVEYIIASIPKIIYFNFKCLPFRQALFFPFLIGWNVKLVEISGKCHIKGKIKPFMVRIGHGGSKSLSSQQSRIRIRKSASLSFEGNAYFSAGDILDIGGELIIGKNFSTNKNCMISCENKVVIGNDVMFGWEVHLFDNDGGHTILFNGKPKVSDPSIYIGNHVWLCSYSHILKGVQVPDDCVVGYRSLVVKKYTEKNSLIVGSPAEVKQHNIDWIH